MRFGAEEVEIIKVCVSVYVWLWRNDEEDYAFMGSSVLREKESQDVIFIAIFAFKPYLKSLPRSTGLVFSQ